MNFQETLNKLIDASRTTVMASMKREGHKVGLGGEIGATGIVQGVFNKCSPTGKLRVEYIKEGIEIHIEGKRRDIGIAALMTYLACLKHFSQNSPEQLRPEVIENPCYPIIKLLKEVPFSEDMDTLAELNDEYIKRLNAAWTGGPMPEDTIELSEIFGE